jgi:hypothetical protein
LKRLLLPIQLLISVFYALYSPLDCVIIEKFFNERP